MSQSSFAEGLRAGVPMGTVVAEKFGERAVAGQSSELHDCGVVYYGEGNAYILCVMTRGNNTSTLAQQIADISKLVHTHVVK